MIQTRILEGSHYVNQQFISLNGVNIEKAFFTFPTGEECFDLRGIEYRQDTSNILEITASVRDAQWVLRLLLILDYFNGSTAKQIILNLPYIPFSRQDRYCSKFQPFTLKWFIENLNSFGNILEVRTRDIHSNVSKGINKLFEHQPFYNKTLWDREDISLVAPDQGARYRVNTLGTIHGKYVVECHKQRSLTGKIEKYEILSCIENRHKFVIIDDICDGGATFIECAKLLREAGATYISLHVSHGFFTKGFDPFVGYIDDISWLHTTEDGQTINYIKQIGI